MISLQFNLRIPGSNRFKTIACWHGSMPLKNKFWELQIYKGADIVDLFLRFTHRQSHAGLQLGIGLLGFNFELTIYDIRHWNNEIKDWTTTS